MQKTIFLLAMLFANNMCFSQQITITSGSKTKTFQPGSWYIIKTSDVSINSQRSDRIYYEGAFTRISADSLEMHTGTVKARNIVGPITVEQDYVYNAKALTTVAVRDIRYLQHYKSKKTYESKKSWNIAGGILILTGAFTALDFIIVDDKESRKELLVYGGIQVGAGIAIAALSSSKKHYFKENERVWKMQ
ncbi:MAG: hypothetical protein IT270_01010 [Saprospiraceae bacterium]|nr:hypothetical protein [Saprospiraceae bacterium]